MASNHKTIPVPEEQVHTINIIWTLSAQQVRSLLSNKLKELNFEKENQQNFKIFLKIESHEEKLLLYYQSTASVQLKEATVSVRVMVIERGVYCMEHSKIIQQSCTLSAYTWHYLTTLFKQDLACCGSSFNASKINDLCLNFEFKISNNLDDNPDYMCDPLLSNDLENILKSEFLSDTVIKSTEGTEYKVHKVIIGSRSTVLRANIEHDTADCQCLFIDSPLESEVLQEVLTFIYTDKAPRLDEMPEKLLGAADYYQLIKLKHMCEESLPKKLTSENAIKILELADLYSADILKQVTLRFIKYEAKSILRSEEWGDFKSAYLLKMICEHIIA